MIEFKINYDSENDDLFVYLEGARSEGAVEAGNFIFDFDEKGNLVAMEILEANKVLKSFLSKIIELSKIKEFKAEATNYRNMSSVKFSLSDDTNTETANILIPRIVDSSPALEY